MAINFRLVECIFINNLTDMDKRFLNSGQAYIIYASIISFTAKMSNIKTRNNNTPTSNVSVTIFNSSWTREEESVMRKTLWQGDLVAD